ncbi:MAG: hypothetical protein GX066_06950 [Clostridiaceae bacterium]|nr:hypothetical protein [Clostridiaceae bacterium]
MQQKMFLIKKSNGIFYNFYLSQTGGICYKLYSLHNNEKMDPFEISIIEEKILEFYVTIDSEDNIHILCLTKDGDLKYFINKENIWNNKVLSHFDLRSNMIRSLFIHVSGKKLYVIYAASNLMNLNLWTIYFKCWDGFKWNNTSVGMTICDKEFPPYYAAVDPQSNIHVVYKNSGIRETQLFYRKFHSQFSLWSTPEKTVISPETIGYYYIYSDTRGGLHLAWATSTGTNYKMLYKKINTKTLNNKRYDRIVTLNISSSPYFQPVIFEIQQKVWVMWKSQNEFYCCEMDPSGISGSAVSPVQYPVDSIPMLVEFINNYEPEKQSFDGRLLYAVPGDFVDLILPKYASNDLYEDIPIDTSDMPPEEFNPSPIAQGLPKEVSIVQKKEQQMIVYDKIDEMKNDNRKILNILEEVKNQLAKRDMVSVLEEIREQNNRLTELIISMLNKDEISSSNEKQNNNGMFKKVFNIFR